jgi:hypothetical protein
MKEREIDVLMFEASRKNAERNKVIRRHKALKRRKLLKKIFSFCCLKKVLNYNNG